MMPPPAMTIRCGAATSRSTRATARLASIRSNVRRSGEYVVMDTQKRSSAHTKGVFLFDCS